MGIEKREKTGGRKKGTPNKLNADARRIFVETLGKHSGNIDKALEEVFKTDKVKFLELFSKYAMYFAPKKSENSDTVKHEFKDFNIKDIFTVEQDKHK